MAGTGSSHAPRLARSERIEPPTFAFEARPSMLPAMRGLVIVVGLFAAVVFDIAENHGAWTRWVVSLLVQGLRALGVH